MRGWFPRHCAVEVYSQHNGEETELFTGMNINFSALYNLRPLGPLTHSLKNGCPYFKNMCFSKCKSFSLEFILFTG